MVDDPVSPKRAYVREAGDGTVYCGGTQDASALAEAVDLLRQWGMVWLPFRPEGQVVDMFPSGASLGAECLEMERPCGASDLSRCRESLPRGFQVVRLDRALIERSPYFDETVTRYGSLADFLDHGFGLGIVHANEVVCAAFADMRIANLREIGVRTAPDFRRRGLATAVCAAAIEVCDDQGCATFWDCARLNDASVRLARRLGFAGERVYRVLGWFEAGQSRPT